VAVNEDCGFTGGVQPVSVDQRMTAAAVFSGFDQAHILHADLLQVRGQRLGGAPAVGLVVRIGGDGGDAQQGFQFIKKTRVILLGKSNGGRRHERDSFR